MASARIMSMTRRNLKAGVLVRRRMASTKPIGLSPVHCVVRAWGVGSPPPWPGNVARAVFGAGLIRSGRYFRDLTD
jgi:hypothetical protein